MAEELKRTIIQDQKVYFGERELTNLVWTLIRIYRYKNNNQEPEAIIFPHIKEVAGIKVEFSKVRKEIKQEEQDEQKEENNR